MKLRIAPIVVAALAATLVPASLPAQAAKARAFTLKRGAAVFWDGPYIEDSSTMTPGPGCAEAPCWEYRIGLPKTGFRLRLGIDHPEVGDVFEVEVFGPNDRRVGTFSPFVGLYSAEFLRFRPRPGTWRIVVTAQDVTDSAFRMRAKLEARPLSVGRGDEPVLPNLQVLPAHDASFLFPVTNGSDPPEGLDLLGAESCHAEERLQEDAVRCLRLAFGVRNTGLGPMQLFFDGEPPGEHDLYQRVYRADGTTFDRLAGVALWHESHAHYHHSGAVGLQLFRVTDPQTGAMDAITERRNKGFHHREELIRDWEHFYPTWFTTGPFDFGLRAGWADIYEWDRPGNYIDFGVNGDGLYLVRMWADPVEGILESNELDNVGYTYFSVSGNEIELLESGRGSDPWDPCKIVVGFGGHPDPPSDGRPANCPPDTT